ncbi:hypothetical protein ACFYN3_41775 [Streptomyces lavendulae]|uniref:hypothetical protein n=1 Tax=Streptomyces lavendulae TaxID=1914 RepID=UPI003688DD70
MTSTHRDIDPALAYPEPPASPLWHRDGPKALPITPEQQRRNRELLLRAQHTPRPRTSRTAKTQAEARR